jgi:hypothetical protein
MRDRLLYLILMANVLVVAGLGAKAVYDYRAFRTLNDEGRMASAIVRDVRPAVRNRLAGRGRWILDYSFTTPANATVDASISVPRATAARFRAGQHIDVVYAPADPSLTALNPEQAWAVVVYDEWVLVPYLATLMTLGWILLERRRSRGP